MPLSALPFELIYEIGDHLRDDPASLANFVRTCTFARNCLTKTLFWTSQFYPKHLVFKWLLEHPVDCCHHTVAPLHWAAAVGNTAAVAWFIRHSQIAADFGRPSLTIATTEVVDPSAPIHPTAPGTAVPGSAAFGSNAAVSTVFGPIPHGATTHLPLIGWKVPATPLFYAVVGGHTETVAFLLNQGADLMTPACLGFSALDIAAEYGHVDIVDFMLARGAGVHNALHHAIGGIRHWRDESMLYGCMKSIPTKVHYEFCHELINDLQVNCNERLMLHHHLPESLQYQQGLHGGVLLKSSENGEDGMGEEDEDEVMGVGLKDDSYIQHSRRLRIVQTLFDYGAIIESRYLGMAPIHVAVSAATPLDFKESPVCASPFTARDACLTQYLLASGANPNSRCNWWGAGGQTPLHRAIVAGQLDIVQSLIEAGADVHAADYDGVAVFDCRGDRANWDEYATHGINYALEVYASQELNYARFLEKGGRRFGECGNGLGGKVELDTDPALWMAMVLLEQGAGPRAAVGTHEHVFTKEEVEILVDLWWFGDDWPRQKSEEEIVSKSGNRG